MDGVLWKENTSLFNLKTYFSEITRLGYQYVLATNNATKSVQQFLDKLQGFGVESSSEHILTSSQATAYYLKQHFPQGGPVYVVGEDGLISTLAEQGFYFSDKDVLAVVAGLDRHITYEKLLKASLLIRAGAAFIGTNPDPTLPTPAGLAPGGGAIIASITTSTEVKPIFIGKPFPTMINMALEMMGTTPETTLVIGDRLDTDILAGQNTACKTALMMSGVTTIKDLERWNPKPDLVLSSADKLIE